MSTSTTRGRARPTPGTDQAHGELLVRVGRHAATSRPKREAARTLKNSKRSHAWLVTWRTAEQRWKRGHRYLIAVTSRLRQHIGGSGTAQDIARMVWTKAYTCAYEHKPARPIARPHVRASVSVDIAGQVGGLGPPQHVAPEPCETLGDRAGVPRGVQ